MKAILLDRDGVINQYPGDTRYVTSWDEFVFLPGAKEAIAVLHKNNFKVIVVSNQAGVSKGLYTQEALDSITRKMSAAVESAGGTIDAVYYCTHRNEDHCPCRKPKPGLLITAAKEQAFDLAETFFVGDTIRDVKTARAAGCKSVLVLSGKEKEENKKDWQVNPDLVFSDLYEAVKHIIKQ
ncbi:D-glycero-beta-D-manno-heptose 1,7-bisphosphate 7-phosphatase [Candidatus Omnitrophota bacterium]